MDSSTLTAPFEPSQPIGADHLGAQPLRRRVWLKYVVVALLFATVAVTLQRGWNELSGHAWQIDHSAVAASLCLWAVATIWSAVCWLAVTRAFGVRLPIAPALRVFCTSNLGKYLPGKVLHVFARVYLVQQQGVPLAVGTTSAMLDVLLYIAAGALLSVFALPLAIATIFGDFEPWLVVVAVLGVAAGFALLHPRALNAILAVLGRFVPRFRQLRFELRYGAIVRAFLLYSLQWLLMTAAVYAGVRSVTTVGPDLAPILGAIFALSYVVGLVTPTPAGLGGREAVMVTLFSFFMPAPAAIVATMLNRVLQVAAEGVCAGLLSVFVRR